MTRCELEERNERGRLVIVGAVFADTFLFADSYLCAVSEVPRGFSSPAI